MLKHYYVFDGQFKFSIFLEFELESITLVVYCFFGFRVTTRRGTKVIGKRRRMLPWCGPGECGRAISGAGGACDAAPEEALRTIRPAWCAGAGRSARRLRRSPPRAARSLAWENANGIFAAALYPYRVIVFDSVVGVKSLARCGDIFGCMDSNAFGDGVLSSGEAFLGIGSFSLEDVESSGWIFCRDTAGDVRIGALSLGVVR